ncbi:MAG TPA: hypothetical protein QF480_09790 [Bacteroidales bacterium]|jgi:hypothetical protein|nr:hypothetical protein [Bacteroidota bacterium]HJN06895.1 hypothetical protein [Bacteroidales bacterium]|tara:strand:- start:213 stop:533 length:321 start_codon:yes stop_codon:yes gene_type:complete
MLIVFIAVYLLITFILTVLGIEKQTEGLKVFLISLFLTPLVGLIYIYSKKSKSSQISYYHCHDCDYIYPVKMKNCPICLEKGVKIKLTKYVSPYKVSEEIGNLNLV